MGFLDGLKKIVGAGDVTEALATENDKQLKVYLQNVEKINALEADYEKLTNDQLRGKTKELRDRLNKGASLDSILVEAFALAREACWRVLELRHFDVQVRTKKRKEDAVNLHPSIFSLVSVWGLLGKACSYCVCHGR